MAHARLGHAEPARQTLAKVQARLDEAEQNPTLLDDPFHRMEFTILRREAQGLLKPKAAK
jgi:hypothetical protein